MDPRKTSPSSPKSTDATLRDKLDAQLRPHGQEHLLAFWNELTEAQRLRLADQIAKLDLAALDALRRDEQKSTSAAQLAERAAPPPAIRLRDRTRESIDAARRLGRQALAAGKLAALLVAGGQGTRLNFDHPKGMFPVGPVSGATLFQLFLEQVLAVGKRYDARVPIYVMTSPATHEETVAYFEEHQRFGVAADDVQIFCQGVMPAVDATTGRILLEAKDQIALSPDGHGGMLPALQSSVGLDALSRRGIQYVHYFQVDNPLFTLGDPEFLGYHIQAESEASTQVIAKRAPLDRVGNVAFIDGRMRIIEYSDLPEDVAERRDGAGGLQLWAGNTGVHVFNVDFLTRCAASRESLPFHLAHKAVATLDAAGNRVIPSAPNAIKFERFIFDLLPKAQRTLAVEVDPAEAFAPIKNAPGAERDSPELSRQALIERAHRWLSEAGSAAPADVPVEISPLFALDSDALRERLVPGTRFEAPTYLR